MTERIALPFLQKKWFCDYLHDCEGATDKMHCFKTGFYCRNCKSFYTPFQKVLDTIEECLDGGDEYQHETFKKAIFFSEQFMIKKQIPTSDGVDNGVLSCLYD